MATLHALFILYLLHGVANRHTLPEASEIASEDQMGELYSIFAN